MPLFFDTETTDKWNFKANYSDPSQPHIVQLGMLLDDDKTREVIAEVNLILELPKGITSQPGAAKVHGITQEKVERYGVSTKAAFYLFQQFASQTTRVVAHNIDFDARVMQASFAREGRELDIDSKAFCTMKSSTGICRIPSTYGKGGYKWPTLQEAYSFLVDPKGFTGAHDAMVDVRACREVYYKLLDKIGQ